jgi:hypothetical protein
MRQISATCSSHILSIGPLSVSNEGKGGSSLYHRVVQSGAHPSRDVKKLSNANEREEDHMHINNISRSV